jgi:hypothetical protein
MSVYSDIRSLADSNFQQESRLQGISFALALALSVKYINIVEGTDTAEETYKQYVMNPVSETISTFNENVLMDIRLCIDLTKKLFALLYNAKYKPVVVNGNGTSLMSVLFSVEDYVSEEYMEFFKQNKTGIINIFNRLNQD